MSHSVDSIANVVLTSIMTINFDNDITWQQFDTYFIWWFGYRLHTFYIVCIFYGNFHNLQRIFDIEILYFNTLAILTFSVSLMSFPP